VQRGAWAIEPQLELLTDVGCKKGLFLILTGDPLAPGDLSGHGDQGV
jgi:hypothetical protein